MKDNQDPFQNELVRFIFETEEFKDWIGLVYNASKDGLTRILDWSGKQTFAELELEGSFDLANPRAVSWVEQNALRDATSYSDDIKEKIAAKIQEGVEQGLSNDGIADNIREYFTENSDYKALRMARTEVSAAQNQGNLEGFRQSGVVSNTNSHSVIK